MSTANPKNQIIVTDRGEPFELTAEERQAIEAAMHHYEDARAATIDALKIVQSRRRWVSDGAITAIAAVLGVAAADVEGVATFYNRIYRQPVGRHVILVCDSIGCYLTGFEKVYQRIQEILAIKPGETTADDKFTVLPVVCLGACDRGPVLLIDEDTHFNVTPENVGQVLEQYA